MVDREAVQPEAGGRGRDPRNLIGRGGRGDEEFKVDSVI